ncbi:hypothetical protein FF1_025656 [Malus domestica]
MARSSRNIVTIAASHADLLLPNAGGLFLFCMILMSFSVISVVIFSCGKSSSRKKNSGTYSGAAGDGTGCGGHGHHGHGGGGDGHGGHGGGDHGGGGGGCGSSINKTRFQEIQAY